MLFEQYQVSISHRMSLAGHLDTQTFCNCIKNHQSIGRSVRFTLLKILVGDPHCVCNVCETKDRLVSLTRECVERGSLHFHGQNSLSTRRRDGCGRFTEGRVRRPAWADMGS